MSISITIDNFLAGKPVVYKGSNWTFTGDKRINEFTGKVSLKLTQKASIEDKSNCPTYKWVNVKDLVDGWINLKI